MQSKRISIMGGEAKEGRHRHKPCIGSRLQITLWFPIVLFSFYFFVLPEPVVFQPLSHSSVEQVHPWRLLPLLYCAAVTMELFVMPWQIL